MATDQGDQAAWVDYDGGNGGPPPPTPGLKFGLLVLPFRSHQDDEEVEVLPGVVSFPFREGELLAGHTESWERSVGNLAWRSFMQSTRAAIVTCPTTLPNVLDAENQALLQQLQPLIDALDLVGGYRRPWGRVYAFSGTAHGPRHLAGVRQMARHTDRIRPFYDQRDEFVRSFDWAVDPWVEEWSATSRLLAAAQPSPLVRLGLGALNHGMGERQLEFRIPDLVRAAETIIGLGRRQGQEVFVRRAVQLAPSLRTAQFLGAVEPDALLREVYQCRIDCVHGMVPFQELRARGDAGALHAARMEYAAEVVAREALLRALRAPGAWFDDREHLEAAWDDGTLPGPLLAHH